MKTILTTLIIFFNLALIHGNNDRINEGASTSTQQDNGPTDRCILCEIEKAAYKLVFLMLSEDRSNRDLIYLMNNEFYELELFHGAITQFIFEAGGPLELPFEERRQRIRYFYTMVERFLFEIIGNACSEHYKFRFYYDCNKRESTVTLFEKIDLLTGQCLCFTNHYEREVLRSTQRLPLPKKIEKKFVSIIDQGNLALEEITVYHIIPIPLIVRFYRIWLMDENIELHQENFFTGCVITLLGRLRRSMQKILLYGLKESGLWASSGDDSLNNDDYSFSNETVLIENLVRSGTWMAGNMFIGPVARGRTNPERNDQELFRAFEYLVEPIIGAQRYEVLLNLNSQLWLFIERAPRMSLVARLDLGFLIFSSMIFIFYQAPITRFNIDQWQEFVSTDGTENFWVIRPNRRDPRSTNYYYEYETMPENATMNLAETKSRWRTFIVNVMGISMEAQSRNESLTWSCDWTYLYSEYLNQPPLVSKSDDICQDCTSFDEFLYQKASNNRKWDNCNLEVESTVKTSKWCAAWRRIMNDIKNAENKKVFGASKWKSISQTDIGTIISWLVSPKSTPEEEYLPKYKIDPLEHKKSSSSFDVGLCLFTTLVPSILGLRWNDCRQTMG